jgi:hypothetical protein
MAPRPLAALSFRHADSSAPSRAEFDRLGDDVPGRASVEQAAGATCLDRETVALTAKRPTLEMIAERLSQKVVVENRDVERLSSSSQRRPFALEPRLGSPDLV